MRCDDSLKHFNPDGYTTVLEVRHVKKGDPFPNPVMDQLVYPDLPATFEADMCWVKLLVGPGHPGPANAPSTSKGIGLEIWLPEKGVWNHRFHAIGGSGSTGSEETLPDKISSWTGGVDVRSAPRVAAEQNAVTSATDSGKGDDRDFGFTMLPNGSVNKEGLRDWSYRALLVQAATTKALIKAYYGSAPKYSYFDGASGGGRQAFHVARNIPTQSDGIIAGDPAFNCVEIIANNWPAIVIINDSGGKAPTEGQLDLASDGPLDSPGAYAVADGSLQATSED